MLIRMIIMWPIFGRSGDLKPSFVIWRPRYRSVFKWRNSGFKSPLRPQWVTLLYYSILLIVDINCGYINVNVTKTFCSFGKYFILKLYYLKLRKLVALFSPRYNTIFYCQWCGLVFTWAVMSEEGDISHY